ncbi:MAG: flagellar hook-associated protein FlgK [bacterium]
MSLSTFAGFEVARSGLNTSQTALNTTNHNIANSGTTGYSRQAALQSVNTPYTVPGLRNPISAGQMGTGVNVSEIVRYRDQFADLQYRKENPVYNQFLTKETYYNQIELIYNEPKETSISANLDAYWKSLQDLANSSEDTSTRVALKEKSLQLTEVINSVATQLEKLRDEADDEIENKIIELNSTMAKICELNKSIVKVECTGQNANDYRDSRDLLLDELSSMVNMQYEELSDGSVNVYIGGKLAVSTTTCSDISVVKTADPEFDGRYVNKLIWSDLGTDVSLISGEIKGLFEVRDEIIPNYLNQLDNFAGTLAKEINAVHTTGYDLNGNLGKDYFTSTNVAVNVGGKHYAKYMTVNPDICADVSKIAASSSKILVDADGNTVKEANNEIAKKMAEVSETKYNIGPLNTTITDYYQSSIAQLGSASLKVSDTVENKLVLLNGISDIRDSVAEVNEDDEMINMLKYQRTYSSAARIITALDEMLQTILGMGA